MMKRMCIYNNKIFLALDNYLIAYSYKKYKSQDEKFHECFKIKIPGKRTHGIDTRLEVIDNYITGIKSLIILVFDLKGLCSAFIYSNAFRNKLYRIALPDWSVTIEDYTNNMIVSDGPIFLAQSNYTFHLYSVPYGISNSFNLQLLCCDSKEYKILQFKCFGPFKRACSQWLLSLLVITSNSSSEQYIKFIGFVSEKNKHAIKYEHLSLHLFFPQCYESVLKAVHVAKIVPVYKTKSSVIEDMEWKESVSVICTRDDCLFFTNAVLKYCCKLTVPLLNIICMKAEFSGSFFEHTNLLLEFENMTVIFITMAKHNYCEVIKQWTDIAEIVTGDILMKGSKQVLLIKQINVDSWQNNCILYDMLSFIAVDLLSHSVMPDKCLKTTFTGLERKVQIGSSSIKEMEYEISQKAAATVDALIKLIEVKMNTECLKSSHNFQESLVDLILSKDENTAESIPLKCELTIKLLEKQQRFVDNQWILSFFFINEGERSICNPSIKVLLKNTEVTCIQKLFVYNSDNSFFCNEYSRQVNPKTKFSIILNFEFSIVYPEDEILMTLTWFSGSEDELNNEIFISKERNVLIQNQVCLPTKISLTDVLNYQIKREISLPGDLLFARASQQRIGLSVSSLHSDISRLENILIKNSFDSANLHLFVSSSGKCITFNNEKSLLFGTHFVLQKCRPNIVEIEAFTRNKNEISLLIHYLYHHLPEDVVISPCLNFKDEFLQMKKKLVISMKNEIDLLISSLNIYNISDKMNYSNISSHSAGIISIPKITYQRIRTVLVKKECITDTILKNFC